MTVNVTKPAINLREKLSELDKPSGIAGQDILKADTPQEVFNYIGAGRRNIFINGDFRVSQRGDYTTSAVATTHNGYWLDRWGGLNDGISSTVQRVTRTINGVSRYAARILCTSGGTGIFGFFQRNELANIPVGETLTVSCWVKTNNPYVCFRSNAFGGSSWNSPTKFPSNGEWHKVSYTFDTTGTTADPDILICAYDTSTVPIATNDYIEIADVQLEVGSVATPFEHRSYGEELALCQRYYQRYGGYATSELVMTGVMQNSGNTVSCNFTLPVQMRARPALEYSSLSDFEFQLVKSGTLSTPSSASLITSISSEKMIYVDLGTSGGTINDVIYLRASNNASAKWAYNAEL